MRELATSNQELGISQHGTVLVSSFCMGKVGGKHSPGSGTTIGILVAGVWVVGKWGVFTVLFLAFYKHLSTAKKVLFRVVGGSFMPTIHTTYNNNDEVHLFNYYLNTQET